MAEEKRKVDFEERRLLIVESKMRQEMIVEGNKIMMTYPTRMNKKGGPIGGCK